MFSVVDVDEANLPYEKENGFVNRSNYLAIWFNELRVWYRQIKTPIMQFERAIKRNRGEHI